MICVQTETSMSKQIGALMGQGKKEEADGIKRAGCQRCRASDRA